MVDAVEKSKTVVSRIQENVRHDCERFQSQITFARMLCDFEPANAALWSPLIDKANAHMEKALMPGTSSDFSRALSQAEALLLPLHKAAKKYTLHCVGHAHIDMNWMWSWPETVAVTNDTFSTAVKLLDEFPDFRFSQSQASVYKIIEDYNPALLAKIKAMVKKGRWEVIASHWVENDANLADAESLCRHLLYTRQYMKELFGLEPEDVPINWAPDTFGHAATIPTYLSRGGVKYLYLHRPGGYTDKRYQAFWWKGPDGSRVLVRNDMQQGYNGIIEPVEMLHSMDTFVKETAIGDVMYVYGIGDHGGGPTRRDIQRVSEMNAWPIFPTLRFSTVREYYELLDKKGAKLPVVEGELNCEFAGCYTSESLVKKGNRYGEARCMDAESAAVVAWSALKQPYPREAMRDNWRNVLFSHFHDILPGSGVHDTRTYAHGLFQNVVASTSMIETQSLRALAAKVNTSSALSLLPAGAAQVAGSPCAGVGFEAHDGNLSGASGNNVQGVWPFVVCNPLGWEREETIEVTIWDQGRTNPAIPFKDRSFVAHGTDKKAVPTQHIDDGHYWGHDWVKLSFPVKISGLGYALYTVAEQEAVTTDAQVRQIGRVYHCSYSMYEREQEGLENDLIRMEVDMVTGGIQSLVDKKSGLELIGNSTSAPVLEYLVERPHGMTAWLVDHTGPCLPIKVNQIKRKLAGPCKCSIEVALSFAESEFTLTYELRAHDPRLYIAIKGTWFQRGTKETGIPVLRMSLPLNMSEVKARYEIPFGVIDRDLNKGEEVPALRWAQVTGSIKGTKAGCVLFNDSKHGHALNGRTLTLTLIRASYDPDNLPEIRDHEIFTALMPINPATSVAEIIRMGKAFNHNLRAIATDVHQGALPVRANGLAVAPSSCVVYAVKKAESANGIIIRLFDPSGKATTAQISLDKGSFSRVAKAQEVDLMERPLKKSSARIKGNTIHVALPGRGIISVLVLFSK